MITSNDAANSCQTQSKSLRQLNESDKENEVAGDIVASHSPQSTRNKPKNDARVEAVVTEETLGRKVTRSGVRGRGGGSPRATQPASTRRTTRSRAAKTSRKKPTASHTSNETDSDSNAPNESVKKVSRVKADVEEEIDGYTQESAKDSDYVPCITETSSTSVRRSTRLLARESSLHTATVPPKQLSSPLLRSQRKRPYTATSPTRPTTAVHQPPPTTQTTQPQPSVADKPTTTAESESSLEVNKSQQPCITPPLEASSTSSRTKPDTPHPVPTAFDPATPTNSESDESPTQAQSRSTDDDYQPLDAMTPPDNILAPHTASTTPSLTRDTDKTLCGSSDPLTKWCTSFSTVVKQDRSKPAPDAALEAGVDNPAPRATGSIQSLSYTDCHTPELAPVSDYHTTTLLPPTEPTKQRLHTPESTDSGISSGRSDRERRERSACLLGGKRLRSVSLERVSLSEIEAKRMSVSRVDSPADGGRDGGSSPYKGEEELAYSTCRSYVLCVCFYF